MTRNLHTTSQMNANTVSRYKRTYKTPTIHEGIKIPQAARVTWLTEAWGVLRTEFNLLTLPPSVLITCGWPSRRARGKASSRNPTEIVVGDWRDNETEAAMVSVHPERFKHGSEVLFSLLYTMIKQTEGRTGILRLGLLHDKATGEVTVLSNDDGAKTLETVEKVIHQLGALPPGFAEIAEPKLRTPAKNRMRKWVCEECGAILRIASDTLGSEFVHTKHRPHVPLMLVKPETEATTEEVTHATRGAPMLTRAAAAGR